MASRANLGASPVLVMHRPAVQQADAASRIRGTPRRVLHHSSAVSLSSPTAAKWSVPCQSPSARAPLPGQGVASLGAPAAGKAVDSQGLTRSPVQRVQHRYLAPTLLQQRRILQQQQQHLAQKPDQKQVPARRLQQPSLPQPRPQMQQQVRLQQHGALPREQRPHQRVASQAHLGQGRVQQAQVQKQPSLRAVAPSRSAVASPACTSVAAGTACQPVPPADNEVVALLMRCQLDQHSAAFLSSGFDTLEALQEMEDVDVRDLGIPRGHWVKLKKHLRENLCKQSSTATTVRSPPPRATGSGISLPSAVAPVFYGNAQIQNDVQKSWERIQEIGIMHAGEVLYKKVFEMAPSARDLMPPEVLAKYRISCLSEDELDSDFVENATLSNMFGKIFNVVGNSVTGMHDLGRLVPMLQRLGARHVGYGAPEEAWEVVVQAVHFTLQKLLGEMFTQDVEHVWMLGLELISSVMIQGMREARARGALA